MSEEIAIKVENVSKDFKLVHEKNTTLKSKFTSLIKGKGSGKSTTKQHALKNISFVVKKGEFFGIVGRNGSGKSTLLKILAEIYQPTKGSVHVAGKLVPFIELGVGFNPELTGRENVYLNGAILGFSKEEIDGFYDSVVEFAELQQFMDKKLKNYSSGMQVRLAFSMAIRAKAEILLIDEVLAVGDADFQRKCFEYFKMLKKEHTTVVFVTHDMGAVREFCDRAILIDEYKIKTEGDPQDIALEYLKMFTENEENVISYNNSNTTRWGNGNLKTEKVEVKLEESNLIVEIQVKVNEPVDKIIYGLHILGSDGQEITAMNNRMILAPDIEGASKGSVVNVKWKMLNVFSDGRYSITLTFIDDISQTLDWFVDAAKFTVRRNERSTTSIIPPVEVTHKINTGTHNG